MTELRTRKVYGVAVPDPIPPDSTFSYGSHPRQQVDFWKCRAATSSAPLIFFVHGGAWARGDKGIDTGYWKTHHFTSNGFALASTNYRLVPEATVEQQAKDVAVALKEVVNRADSLNVDPERIVLLGHSAGAHLVTLLGTDGRWLSKAGLSFDNIAGIIGNDGASYDAPLQIGMINPAWRAAFIDAFGQDVIRQKDLSPLCHASAPNVRRFLLLHTPDRSDGGIIQAHDLAKALRTAGSHAEVHLLPVNSATAHHEVNLRLGEPDFVATTIVDTWLEGLFPRSQSY